MKIGAVTIALLTLGVFLASCNIARSPYPEKNCNSHLAKSECSSNLMSDWMNGGELSNSEVRGLQASGNSFVRFLVAKNPTLTHEQIAVSIASSDDFTRSGAALNTNLSSRQIAQLMDDKSHIVYSSLAANPALTDAQVMRIRERHKVQGFWFAMNPNCPASIRESILASDDSLAKDWLKITDGWKKDGRYVQDREGRWKQPRPSKTNKPKRF